MFYTDAQLWDEKEGDFDAKTADDWDIDTNVYKDPGKIPSNYFNFNQSCKKFQWKKYSFKNFV